MSKGAKKKAEQGSKACYGLEGGGRVYSEIAPDQVDHQKRFGPRKERGGGEYNIAGTRRKSIQLRNAQMVGLPNQKVEESNLRNGWVGRRKEKEVSHGKEHEGKDVPEKTAIDRGWKIRDGSSPGRQRTDGAKEKSTKTDKEEILAGQRK